MVGLTQEALRQARVPRTDAEETAEALGIGPQYRAVMAGQMTVPELMASLRLALQVRWSREAESEEAVVAELFGPPGCR